MACHCRYRFVELYYRRSVSTHKGRQVPARVETVVIFLPDVWSCVPTRLEWDSLADGYRRLLHGKDDAFAKSNETDKSVTESPADPAAAAAAASAGAAAGVGVTGAASKDADAESNKSSNMITVNII